MSVHIRTMPAKGVAYLLVPVLSIAFGSLDYSSGYASSAVSGMVCTPQGGALCVTAVAGYADYICGDTVAQGQGPCMTCESAPNSICASQFGDYSDYRNVDEE